MKTTYKLTTIVIVAVVLSSGIGYFVGYSLASSSLNEKNNQIASLQEEINAKENGIISLKDSINSKENQIASLESSIDNMKNFERMLLKGMLKEDDALKNAGYASSDYDDFSRNYDGNYYEVAQMYADSVDTYYSYARSSMDDAKGLFKQARKHAPNEKYRQLIDNYIKVGEYAIQIYSEMHQAGEYFSSACGYYANGDWAIGNAELEEANEHISIHDNLIDNYNEYLSNIDAILDDW